MYDLKTATRLYVLEGHHKRTTACSFSPDGRRLVTVSLEESVVLVWKVGSSFSSFFNPGAPPRQGHGGSEPFKTLSFNIGDEGSMVFLRLLFSFVTHLRDICFSQHVLGLDPRTREIRMDSRPQRKTQDSR